MIVVVSQIPSTVSQIMTHVVSAIPEPNTGLIVTHPSMPTVAVPPCEVAAPPSHSVTLFLSPGNSVVSTHTTVSVVIIVSFVTGGIK